MSINFKLIEAIQSITAIGLDMAKAADCIEELEHSANYWKNSAREFEQRLETSERVCANEADLRTTLEVKYEALVSTNESLWNKVAEATQVKERVLQELSDDHNAFDEERRNLVARVDELFDSKQEVAVELEKTNELLDHANTEVDASRARIKELETELSAALTANWTEAVVPKLTVPETEAVPVDE